MSTRVPFTYPGAPIEVEGAGLTIEVETTPPHEILLSVEYDDSTWGGPHTSEQYVSISPEDWGAIVAYVEAQRTRLHDQGASS